MATYYISPVGSDSNNGLGPDASHGTNKPWRTLGKLLGAAGFASGDTAYVAPGVYRETVTVAMTSATAETSVLGDPGNAQGFKNASGVLLEPGEVIWSAYLTGDQRVPSTTSLVTLAGRDYLTFAFITFVAGTGDRGVMDASTASSTNITIRDCAILGTPTQRSVHFTTTAGTALNLLIDRCTVTGCSTNGGVSITVTRHSADYDTAVLIRNCMFWSPSASNGGVEVLSTGAGAGFGGGVDIVGCTMYGASALATADASISTTIPCTITGSLILSNNVGLNANTAGQITEDYNAFYCGTARTNVTAGANSVSDFSLSLLVNLGQVGLYGFAPQQFFAPRPGAGVLNFASYAGLPSTDYMSKPRPGGGGHILASGTATSATSTTLTNTAAEFTDEMIGAMLRITGGTGSGQVKPVKAATATQLTVEGNWDTTPSTDSTYIVYVGPLVQTGKATSGGGTTLADTTSSWRTNQWAGFTVEITAGQGSGQTRTVTSNTSTTLTVPTWTTNPNNTSVYALYRTSLTATHAALGALERHDAAERETTTTDAGSIGGRLVGPGIHEFDIPVDASSTTISVKLRYDSNHGTTNKPRAILLAQPEIGVTTETKTMTSGADTWDTLTFAAQTPSAAGIVTVQVESRSDTPYGKCFFDTFSIT